MDYGQTVGFMAAFLGGIALIPEIIKALRTRHLEDVAWGMLFLLFLCSGLWCFYGFVLEEYPLVLSAGLNMCMQIMLMLLKRKYTKKIILNNNLSKYE